ncbi:MAG TPA: hydroxyacylglutathione hydrolase [Steroidobacteraceae bacterium]|nr:hydroxyacylglutathione hydrolase [Steroidobacteraceae bacterium]
MHVERIWPDTKLRNYHYLVVCTETGEALAVDPFDAQLMLDTARRHGWTITQILNTHHHHDHIAGNGQIRAATGARVLAHAGAAAQIGEVDVGLADGDVIRVGRGIELECMDTPGHTLSHMCLFAHAETPALFSGDTLFNAGAGNCHQGGDPVALYETFATRLTRLPAATRIYPGHDYLVNNLGFTLAREPGNDAARQLKAALEGSGPLELPLTTLGEEQRFNTFFRLGNAEIIAGLREHFSELPEQPAPRDVFVALRALRNKW